MKNKSDFKEESELAEFLENTIDKKNALRKIIQELQKNEDNNKKE